MLIPKKHLRLSETILSLSASVLELLREDKKLEILYHEIKLRQSSSEISGKHDFDSLILALGFLYSIDVITLEENGNLKRK